MKAKGSTDPVWMAGMVAIVVALIGAFVAVAVLAPPETLNKIGNAIDRMPEIAKWITELSVAIGALGAAAVALRNRLRPDQPSNDTPMPPSAGSAVMLLACAAAVAGALPGCGSTFQTHMAAIDATAQVVAAGSDAVHVAATRDAEARCPMPDQTLRALCVDQLRPTWAPADVVVDGAHLALSGWLEAAVLARSSGDWTDAIGAIGRFVLAWERFGETLRSLHLDVPALPDPVINLIRAAAGE